MLLKVKKTCSFLLLNFMLFFAAFAMAANVSADSNGSDNDSDNGKYKMTIGLEIDPTG